LAKKGPAAEPSPFSVIAREVLSELELPHIIHYCPRGSVHRDAIIAKTGTCQLPFLEDPGRPRPSGTGKWGPGLSPILG
jgi:hypothetical protein